MGFVKIKKARGKDAEPGFAEPGRRIKTVQGKAHLRGLVHRHGRRFLWVLSLSVQRKYLCHNSGKQKTTTRSTFGQAKKRTFTT